MRTVAVKLQKDISFVWGADFIKPLNYFIDLSLLIIFLSRELLTPATESVSSTWEPDQYDLWKNY